MLFDCLVEARVPGHPGWRHAKALRTNCPRCLLGWARLRAILSDGWLHVRLRVKAHPLLPYRTLWDSHLDATGVWTLDELLKEVTRCGRSG